MHCGSVERPGANLLRRGDSPPIFLLERSLKTISIFVDESGDFGRYDKFSHYYVITILTDLRSAQDEFNKANDDFTAANASNA